MRDAITLLGQSNGSNLVETSNAPAPMPGTAMLKDGAWVPPVNTLATFCNELTARTGKPVSVIMGTVGGSVLVGTPFPVWRAWFGQTAPNSPLVRSQSALRGMKPQHFRATRRRCND